MTDTTKLIREALTWVRSSSSWRNSATTWKACESWESEDVHIKGQENFLIAILRQQPNNGDFEARCDGTHNYLARYIAACNPEAITALLARLDAAEAGANRLKFMSSCEAQICWNRDTGMCSIWRIENEDNEDAQWVRLAKGNFGTYQEAIDAAIAQGVKP